MAATGQVTKAEMLLALADKRAREVQVKRGDEEYGITSSQMQGLILALGDMLDEYEKTLSKYVAEYMAEIVRKSLR